MTTQHRGPVTTPEHALEGLRHAILARQLRPGQRINQEDVAEALGVSVAPVREALRTLEQEGQVSYIPRRGYFVTQLSIDELEEIYGLRRVLEDIAARTAVPNLNRADIERIEIAARDCADAAEAGDIAAELAANRRFHFAILRSPNQPHTHRMIRLLWDSTEAYRAMYYNSAAERHESIQAHDRILESIREGEVDGLISELDDHRQRALEFLRELLSPAAGAAADPVAAEKAMEALVEIRQTTRAR
jgi:DNA-binding GntR family transcriptional regulator